MGHARLWKEKPFYLFLYVCTSTYREGSCFLTEVRRFCTANLQETKRGAVLAATPKSTLSQGRRRSQLLPWIHNLSPLLLDNVEQGIHTAPETSTIPGSSRMVYISSKPWQNILEDRSHCQLEFSGCSKSKTSREGYIHSRRPAPAHSRPSALIPPSHPGQPPQK